MLNSDKTDVIVLGPKIIRDSLSNNIFNPDAIALASSSAVRNLAVIFDQELSFNSHIRQIHGRPSFTSVTLLKSPTSCLNKMQKNWFTHLLLSGWITIILHFKVALIKF